MKRILVTGNGKSGSWRIRGEQLGQAIGATIVPHATDPRGFDLAVVIKRPDPRTLVALRAYRIPFVWDVVDAWPQPAGNLWKRSACLAWLANEIATIKPHAIVAATQAMMRDIVEIGFKGPVVTVRHHARPNQTVNPICPTVHTVGYEGGVQYLGKWERLLMSECQHRGWKLLLNPPQLADLDIVVALREACGYAASSWKSNVKLANAQGTGTPFIGNREAGYWETASFGERWADTGAELSAAFDELTSLEARRRAAADLRTATPTLESTAALYRAWLETI